MDPLDYGRSFLIGRWPENQVRFWVESRTRILDGQTSQHEDYLQAASCKSEDTFAARDLFYADNYDFLPVFGPQWGVIFRRRAYLTDTYKTVRPVADMWSGQDYHLVEVAGRELTSNDDVLAATRSGAPIVAQIELGGASGPRAIIECPVKTMNTHSARRLYQVDTGPVVLPDLSRPYERHVDGMRLVFVAFNAPDFADFVIETPTPVGPPGQAPADAPMVHHYSQRLSLPSRNRLFALPQDRANRKQ